MHIRVACHVHSDWSYDGKLSLPEIASAFSKRGYRAVMLTEHDQGFDEARRQAHREACKQVSTEEILLVPGIEYSDASNTLHFLVWDNVPFVGTGLAADEIIAATQAAGAVVVFAHPSRRDAWKLFNPDWANKLVGIELWNRKTDGWAPSRDAQLLLKMTEALPFVGLDFHDRRQFFPLATIMKIETSITEVSILSAMRDKRCSSEVFRFPLESFSHGIGLQTLWLAEFFRRKAAPIYRKFSNS
jgi:PHP domain